MIYEILIRGKADGTISGSHVIEFDANGQPGLPRPIAQKDWPSFVVGINTSLLSTEDAVASKQAELETLTQQKQAEIGALKQDHATTLNAISAVVNDESTPTDVAVLAIVTEATKDDTQKKRDALTTQIETLQKQLSAL